jgi:alkylhydroperoxidase/carboxymuconolactone decarboxylase family protein YurZ
MGLAEEIVEVLGGKTFELLCIAIDANVTHIYHPGTRRHIDAALQIGVSPREILDVIELVSIQGIRSMDVGIRILEEQYADLNGTA